MVKTYEFNGKEYTKKEVEEALETVYKVVHSVFEIISKIAKEVSDTFQRIADYIAEKRVNRQYVYNWYVPLRIMKTSQVLNKKPLFIRNKNTI